MMLLLTLQDPWVDEESDGVTLYLPQYRTAGLNRVSILTHLFLCKVFISSKFLISSLWIGDNERMWLLVVFQD